MTGEHEYHVLDLLPAYVVDALTDEETNQVVEHLTGCLTCQAELARLQQVADDLPLALAQITPPPRVKDNLMSAIHSRRVDAAPAKQPTAWQKRTGFLRMPLPAIGLAFIVLLALGNLLLLRQLNLASRQTTTPMQVIALANTQNAPGAVGTLIMNQPGDYGTVVVDNLTILDSSHQYQVWLVKSGQRVSGGLFSVNPEGYGSFEIQALKPLSQYDSIGITIEPLGGSSAPTGPKVLGGTIPH